MESVLFNAEIEEEMLFKIYDKVRPLMPFRPQVGIIMSSLYAQEFLSHYEVQKIILFSDIPGLDRDKVIKQGSYNFIEINGVPVVLVVDFTSNDVMGDYYIVARPVRLLRFIGVRTVITSSFVASLKRELKPETFFVVRDYCSLFVNSPLVGPNLDDFGPRSPDMRDTFDRLSTNRLVSILKKNKFEYGEGTICQMKGPQFETPCEISVLQRLGLDTLTMGASIVFSSIILHHFGLKVIGLAIISNYASGMTTDSLDIKALLSGIRGNVDDMVKIFESFVPQIALDKKNEDDDLIEDTYKVDMVEAPLSLNQIDNNKKGKFKFFGNK